MTLSKHYCCHSRAGGNPSALSPRHSRPPNAEESPTFSHVIPAQAGIPPNMNSYSVYIMASHRHGTLYVGVTSDLERRCSQHHNDDVDGFSKKYHTHSLVSFEETSDIRSAIEREKCIKKWNRSWKIRLIESMNPSWRDLATSDDGQRDSRLRGNDNRSSTN
jgi:putative endonuclease